MRNKKLQTKVQGLYVDRKMLGILLIFIFLGISLVSTLIIATNTLSGLRAYSTLQSYWTESRKDGVYELARYLETGDVQHLDDFDNALELIRDARYVRNELISNSPDYDLVREKLLAIHTEPRDINTMIKIFERLYSLEHLSDAVQLWEEANQVIEELEEIALHLRQRSEVAEVEAEKYIARIWELDNSFRLQKSNITASLSEGTQLVTNIIILVSLALGGILLICGTFLSYRFLKSIKVWANRIDMSEQRYKSLFEQNPNVVFSLNDKGVLVSGNEVFYRLTGYTKEDLQVKDLNSFSFSNNIQDIEGRFNQALKGQPQSQEIRWQQLSGEEIVLHATMLPIRVDGEIEGVFVIAEDVTYQKFAEEKIKSQLKEKVSLLGEVHDRVKNNLALISSMLQLQEAYLDDEIATEYLESTISRIKSLAMVHERLYKTENFTKVRLDEFIHDLVASIQKSFQEEEPRQLDIKINADPVKLDIKQAVPSGLLLNELILNAFKFAFKGRQSGELLVELKEHEDYIEIIVKDNGVGLPDNFDLKNNSTLGMTLIRTLSKQLKAQIHFESNDGTEFRFQFNSTSGMLKSA